MTFRPYQSAQTREPTQDGDILSAYDQTIVEPLGRFSQGFAKGLLTTTKNVLGLLQSGGQRVLAAIDPGKTYEDVRRESGFETLKPETRAGQAVSRTLTPEGPAETLGFGAEQFSEFFVPASKAAKAEQAVTLLSQGIKSPLLAAATRLTGKAAVQAGAAGAVRLAQTGEPSEATEAALFAGGTRAALGAIGETARAFSIPERLYSRIFKNTKDDMFAELRSDALQNLQRTDPQRFNELVKAGIVKIDRGAPLLNETLAEQAIDRGLRGSLSTMANRSVRIGLESEAKVREIAQSYPGTVDLSEKQFLLIAKQIAKDYRNVGFGEIAEQADEIAKVLSGAQGKVDAVTALRFRRLLDGVRRQASYDKAVTDLSMTQANLKTLSDTLRSRLNSLPKMGEVMKDYSFAIDSLEALAAEATRRGNNQIVGLIDSFFLSSAAMSATPQVPLTVGILRRVLNSPTGLTELAQLLLKSNMGPALTALLGSGATAVSDRVELNQ